MSAALSSRHPGADDARKRIIGNPAGAQTSVTAMNTAVIAALDAIASYRAAGHGFGFGARIRCSATAPSSSFCVVLKLV